MKTKGKPLIVKIEPYDGNDSYLKCGVVEKEGESAIFMVVDNLTGEELDTGYESYEQAKKWFPEAVN